VPGSFQSTEIWGRTDSAMTRKSETTTAIERPFSTPKNSVPAKAMTQRAKSGLRTRHSLFASSTAIKLTTEAMTTDAKTKRGSLRAKFGMIASAIIRTQPVTKPANGVRAPVELATAERENEPATGYPLKKEPAMFANPTARSSRVDGSDCPNLAAKLVEMA